MKSDFLSEPIRKSVTLTSALLNYSRPPGLNLVPLGTAWSLDPLARVNNAARRAFIDLFTIIDSMQRRVHDLRTADLQLFFKWWEFSASFVTVALASYESVVIPWLSSCSSFDVTKVPPDVSLTQAQAHSSTLEGMVSAFDAIDKQRSRRAPDESLARMIKAIAEVKLIIEFYAAMENSLPPVIESHFNQPEVKVLERRLATYLQKTGTSHVRRMHLHFMARGMTDESVSAWLRLIPLLTRFSYETYTTKFHKNCVAVVYTLASQ